MILILIKIMIFVTLPFTLGVCDNTIATPSPSLLPAPPSPLRPGALEEASLAPLQKVTLLPSNRQQNPPPTPPTHTHNMVVSTCFQDLSYPPCHPSSDAPQLPHQLLICKPTHWEPIHWSRPLSTTGYALLYSLRYIFHSFKIEWHLSHLLYFISHMLHSKLTLCSLDTWVAFEVQLSVMWVVPELQLSNPMSNPCLYMAIKSTRLKMLVCGTQEQLPQFVPDPLSVRALSPSLSKVLLLTSVSPGPLPFPVSTLPPTPPHPPISLSFPHITSVSYTFPLTSFSYTSLHLTSSFLSLQASPFHQSYLSDLLLLYACMHTYRPVLALLLLTVLPSCTHCVNCFRAFFPKLYYTD